MIKTKKFEDLPQITSISPSGKIIVIEQGIDKIISFEDFSNLPPTNDVWNNAGTTFTASEVNVTDTQSAADSKLLDLKVNTVSKFVVRKDGNLGIGVANPAARLDISDTVLAGSGSLAGSILNLAQTWNTTGNPTAIKLNVTNTSSGAASNLLDLQVGGSTKMRVDKNGVIFLPENGGDSSSLCLGGSSITNCTAYLSIYGIRLSSDLPLSWASARNLNVLDTHINRGGVANIHLGAPDSAAPVAQTLSVQSVIAGTTNTAGANFTIDGSQGTGTGIGGSIVFRTAKATTSSSTVNSLTEAMSINSNGLITLLQAQTGTGGLDLNGYGLISSFDWQLRNVNGFIGIGANFAVADTRLYRDAANILALRNGVNPQAFRLYNTYTDTDNYERGYAQWSSNAFIVGYEFAGTGNNGRIVVVRGSSSGGVRIDNGANIGFEVRGGNFLALLDNTYDIGANAATRPRTGYFGTSIVTPTIVMGSSNQTIGLSLYGIDLAGNGLSRANSILLTSSTANASAVNTARIDSPSAGLIELRVADDTAFASLGALSLSLSGQSLSGSTATSLVDLSTTWNTTGAPNAIKLNVTNTASGAASNLLDLQVDTVSRFKVNKVGDLTLAGSTGITLTGGGGFRSTSYIDVNVIGLITSNSGALGFSSGSIGSTYDTALFRDAAGTLAQRNGVNPQTSRIYGTYTNASNYARLAISCDTSGNAILATEGLGTGAAGTISIGNANKIILGTSAGVDLAFRATDSTSVGFRIGSGNTLEIVRSDAGAYANITANNITLQGTLSTIYAAINSNVNVAPTTGEHVALIASSSSNGTAANGFGTRIVLRTESSTTAARDSGAISTLWSDATDATRTSDLLFYNALNGTLTERMRILGSNGNVGIGTNSPTTPLTIQSNSSGNAFNILGMAGNFLFQVGGVYGVNLSSQGNTSTDGFLIGTDVNSSNAGSMLRFQTKGSTRLVVDYLGNIGIGTTTPSTKLEIVTTGANVDGLKLNRAADDRTAWLVDEGTGAGALYLFNGSNSNSVFITGNGNSHISSGTLGLGVSNSSAAKLDILDTTLAGSGSLAGSILNLAQTWNTTGAPTAIKLNVTNTASGAASNLLDLQVGGVSQFKVDKAGEVTLGLRLKNTSSFIYLSPNNVDALIVFNTQVRTLMPLGFSNNGDFNDTFLRRRGVANLQIGAVDDATPVAQTLSVQSVYGPTNTAGANFTIAGSQGTGTGAGGSIIFQTAPAGSSGSTQNPLSAALTIDSNRNITIGGPWNDFTFNVPAGGGSRSFSIKDGSNTTFQVGTAGMVVLGYLAMGASTPNPDILLQRDAANTLGLRNGVNPQTFRLYNTYTDATTFERLNIKWDTNVLKIGTEKGASGGTARAMELQTDGVTRAVINSNGITVGNLNINPTNSAIYNAVIIGFGTNTAYVASPSDGVLRITNNALTSFNRLQFGGETASFPAIKRNGAGIQIRLADDSANAALETAGLTVVGSASVSGHFSAATKSFLIDHPTKEGKKLQYGVVESNQHSVLVRGKTAENIIELPEEWAGLVHEDSVTVQLTPIGSYQQLFVISQDNQRVVVGGSTGQYNYTIYGERKDVDKLITEI